MTSDDKRFIATHNLIASIDTDQKVQSIKRVKDFLENKFHKYRSPDTDLLRLPYAVPANRWRIVSKQPKRVEKAARKIAMPEMNVTQTYWVKVGNLPRVNGKAQEDNGQQSLYVGRVKQDEIG